MTETLTSSQYQGIHIHKGKDRSSVVELPRSRRAAPGRRRGSGKQSEASIHQQFCAYVRNKYPDAIFTSESSGIRLTMGQAVKAKKLRSTSGLPDFWLVEPRVGYAGLFLELKRNKEEVYRKDGSLKMDDRIIKQSEVLGRLNDKGYYAAFACGLTEAMMILDHYMSKPRR